LEGAIAFGPAGNAALLVPVTWRNEPLGRLYLPRLNRDF
jgi:hypothetical protein